MSNTLTIVARIVAKAEKLDLVKSELLKLIEPTRKEKGCISYTLQQDNDNPQAFMFFETWENRELWQIHMGNDHLKAYVEATEGAVDEFVVQEMSQIA